MFFFVADPIFVPINWSFIPKAWQISVPSPTKKKYSPIPDQSQNCWSRSHGLWSSISGLWSQILHIWSLIPRTSLWPCIQIALLKSSQHTLFSFKRFVLMRRDNYKLQPKSKSYPVSAQKTKYTCNFITKWKKSMMPSQAKTPKHKKKN